MSSSFNIPSISTARNILVIKHGAFGDVVKSLKAFEALKTHLGQHTKLSLLTEPLYATFLKDSPYFDAFIEDTRPKSVIKQLKLLLKLCDLKFDLIIDLQNSGRSRRYCWFLKHAAKAQIAGSLKGADIYQDKRENERLHPYEKLSDLLDKLGVQVSAESFSTPNLSWIKPYKGLQELPKNYALLIPGSSPHTLAKRLPSKSYAKIAIDLIQNNITPILIGSKSDAPVTSLLTEMVKKNLLDENFSKRSATHLQEPSLATKLSLVDLTGKTNLSDLYTLGQGALFILGNDTGPTFMASMGGRPTIVPWSNYCKKELNAPKGAHITLIEEANLENLDIKRLEKVINNILEDPLLRSNPL